jgi:hypothetical protein
VGFKLAEGKGLRRGGIRKNWGNLWKRPGDSIFRKLTYPTVMSGQGIYSYSYFMVELTP